jgi:hypothetical protein
MPLDPITGLNLSYARRDSSQILADLKQQLATVSNGEWTDFSESDIGYAIIKALVAIADLNAYFTDQSVAETFLSTCQLRESAIRRAKELDYISHRATPAIVSVLLSVPSFNVQLEIPSGSTWLINDIAFTNNDLIIIPQGQTSLNITLTQGSTYTYTTTSPGVPFWKITIPQNSSDIQVRVDGEIWEPLDTFIGALNPQSYKIYEDVAGQIICFGANVSTYIPQLGKQVVITAVITQGSDGNIEALNQRVTLVSNFTDNVGNTINTTITGVTTTSALGGQDVESIDSIRENAPAIYGTQGRAVTAADYQAIVKALPGVKDAHVVGGETVGRYGTVLITAYGDDPYTVSSDFLTEIYNALVNLNVVTVKPIVSAPVIVECQLTVNLGIDKTVYVDPITAQNLVNTAINQYFDNLLIADSMYQSQLSAAIQAIPGIVFADFVITTDTFVNSHAGSISVPLYSNPDPSSMVLRDNSGNLIYSGKGNNFIAKNAFVTVKAGLSDQKVTLTYSPTKQDIVLLNNQVVILTDLNITSNFA